MPQKEQSGFSLIEVMIAMLLVSILLLSSLNIIHVTMQEDQQSQYRTAAYLRIENMAEALQANDPSFESSWTSEIASQLPQGSGAVLQQGDRAMISVKWFDKAQQQDQILKLTVAV